MAAYEQIEKLLAHLRTLNTTINPHSFNNYLPIGVGNNTTIEFDINAKAWFWSDAKLKRFPLDLFYADYILTKVNRVVSDWDNSPTGTMTFKLPNGTEAKHTVYRLDGKTTVSIGFTNTQGSYTSGGLDKSQCCTLIRVMQSIFGDLLYESNTKLCP